MLMMASGCFISTYLKAIVAACDRSQLSNPKARPRLLVIKLHKRLVNMEISELASQLTELHALWGADVIAALCQRSMRIVFSVTGASADI